jgi:nucleoside-diphosphate-sugar epimerase
MEQTVSAANSGALRCSILRGGRFVGPGTGQENAIAALRNGSLRVAGEGLHFISPVHVKDYARAIALALEAADPPPIANINAAPLREGDYYDALADASGVRRPARDPSRPAPPSHRCSAALAASSLGWVPNEPLIENRHA